MQIWVRSARAVFLLVRDFKALRYGGNWFWGVCDQLGLASMVATRIISVLLFFLRSWVIALLIWDLNCSGFFRKTSFMP